MKKCITLTFIVFGLICQAQSAIQTINSGSVIDPKSMISVGEIYITPANANLPSSGIIGILAQVNQQQLEVNQFALTENISVYPNPTVAKIYFESKENLQNQKVAVYDNLGKLIRQTKVATDNSVDLESLSSGIFVIQLNDNNVNSFKIIKH